MPCLLFRIATSNYCCNIYHQDTWITVKHHVPCKIMTEHQTVLMKVWFLRDNYAIAPRCAKYKLILYNSISQRETKLPAGSQHIVKISFGTHLTDLAKKKCQSSDVISKCIGRHWSCCFFKHAYILLVLVSAEFHIKHLIWLLGTFLSSTHQLSFC